MNSYLDKFKDLQKSMNFVESDWSFSDHNVRTQVAGEEPIQPNSKTDQNLFTDSNEKLFLPFTGKLSLSIKLVFSKKFTNLHQKQEMDTLAYRLLVNKVYLVAFKKA